jgi:hypothetical protein
VHRRARESSALRSTRTRATAGLSATPDARSTRTGCRASAGRLAGEGRPTVFRRCPAPARAKRRTIGAHRRDVPLLENVLLTPRSRVGTFSRVAIPGSGAPEKRVTATKQAVETPGGGRNRPRMKDAPRHRRAASRSGGAMSAERDGRPVRRRTRCSATPRSVPDPGDRWPSPDSGDRTGPRR